MKNKLTLGLAALVSFNAVGMDSSLTVGLMNQDRAPYFWKTKDTGELKGAYIDILSEITAKTGITFDYKFLPQARIRHYMKNHILDVEPGIAKEWRREDGEAEATVFSDVFYKSEEVIVYSPTRFHTHDLQPRDFEELKPCSILGFNDIEFKNKEEDKDLTSEEQIIFLLKIGRCDYAVFPTDVIQNEIEYGYLNATRPIAYYNLRLRLSKEHEHLLPEINRVLQEMKDEGRIEKIIKSNQESYYAL